MISAFELIGNFDSTAAMWLNSWGECSLNPCFCHFGTFGALGCVFFGLGISDNLRTPPQEIHRPRGAKLAADWNVNKIHQEILILAKRKTDPFDLLHVLLLILFRSSDARYVVKSVGKMLEEIRPSSWDKSILFWDKNHQKHSRFCVCLPYQAGAFWKRTSEPSNSSGHTYIYIYIRRIVHVC